MKKKNKIVVAVSGGFDCLHAGHIKYFKEAKKLGDKLVVMLNSDRFLEEKKGFVFMKYLERKEIIEALECVDLVIPVIDEDQTVCKALRALQPNIFAKGGDRTIENIPEKAICEELGIKMVFEVGGCKIQSSSKLVEDVCNKIRKNRTSYEDEAFEAS